MEMRLPVIFEIKLIVISSFYVNSGREREGIIVYECISHSSNINVLKECGV